MTKYFSLLLLVACASCLPPNAVINICLVDSPVSNCAKGDVKTQPKFPEEMSDYVSFDEVGLDLFASRKEECLQGIKSNHNTLAEMLPCVIHPTKDPLTPMPTCVDELIINYMAVDRVSWGRIRNFMSYCGEHP